MIEPKRGHNAMKETEASTTVKEVAIIGKKDAAETTIEEEKEIETNKEVE